jgi:exodeoxyribonuclease III
VRTSLVEDGKEAKSTWRGAASTDGLFGRGAVLVTANPYDTKNHGFTPEERKGFDAFVKADLVDSYRAFEKAGGHYTWWSPMGSARARNIGWRLDYFLVSAALRPRLKQAFIRPEVRGSDHCPVGIEIK